MVRAEEERERREERLVRSENLNGLRTLRRVSCARRGSRSFVAPAVEPSVPLRLSRRMKYTSMENWRRIDRDFRAPTFLPALCWTPLSYNASRRKHTRFLRRRILFITAIHSKSLFIFRPIVR